MKPSFWDQRKQHYETVRLTPEDCREAMKTLRKLREDQEQVSHEVQDSE